MKSAVRHHDNFNKRDNDPTNIIRMSWYNHTKLHHDGMIGENNPMKDPKIREKARSANKVNNFYNHKVVKVEDAGYEDVYCFSVEKYQNFAVDIDEGKDCSSGIFVHNCPDFRMRFEKELFDDNSLIGNWRRYDARKIDKGTDIDFKDKIKDPKTQDYFPLGKSYVRKTPPPGRTVYGKKSGRWIVGREFVNPYEYQGFCKHLWSFLWYLRGAKLLVS